LSPAAKKKFRETVKHQESMGLETPVDRDVIALYADLWVWLEQCRQFLRKHGDSFPTYDADGNATGYRAYPEVATAIKLAREVQRLEEILGLCPSGRTRLQVAPKLQAPQVSSRPRFQVPIITPNEGEPVR
jgi:P27 family predicted phage terminase small subunit